MSTKRYDTTPVKIEFELPAWLAGEFEHVLQEIHSGDLSRLEKRHAERERGSDAGVVALETIIAAIRQHPGTGQVKRLLRFLAGLYNSYDFPFALHELRGIDRALSDACLAVLAEDVKGIAEIHRWGVITGKELEALFTDYGLYYEARARLLARKLYEEKYGSDGHPDDQAEASYTSIAIDSLPPVNRRRPQGFITLPDEV